MTTRLAFLVPLAGLALAVLVGLMAVVQVLNDGLSSGLPDRVTHFRGHNRVRYYTHTSLARLVSPFDDRVATLQWWRAAAHTRSDREVEEVVSGLAAVRRRDPSMLERTLCPYVAEGLAGTQDAVARRLPLRCDARVS